jgi:hypothetical protein
MPRPRWCFQYSPESFTGTELDYAVEICEAVMDVWPTDAAAKVILNLPATVEMATPNIYADQIEWFGRTIRDRDSDDPQPASAQRPRHRGRRGRTGADGRRRPGRGHAVRQWRAHRQCRCRDAGAQPVQPGRRSRHRDHDIDDMVAPSNTATSCRCIRAIPMPASWSSPRSPARIRTRSRRGSTR